MDLGLKGKVAFVAGGSKGIGQAAARYLAQDGCRVAIVAREQDAIDRMVSSIESQGGEAIGISADLSSQDGVEAAVAEVRCRLGSPDIAISQASAPAYGQFLEVDVEQFQKLFGKIVMNAIYLARAVIPDMRAKKWGRFIHIGSLAAKEAVVEFPHLLFNTVSPSVMGLLRSLSDEFARDGITFNQVGPGWCKTPTTDRFMVNHLKRSADELDQWLCEGQFIPVGRAGRPEEVGSMIAYLCSDMAAYCTGTYITVDGGKHRSNF